MKTSLLSTSTQEFKSGESEEKSRTQLRKSGKSNSEKDIDVLLLGQSIKSESITRIVYLIKNALPRFRSRSQIHLHIPKLPHSR